MPDRENQKLSQFLDLVARWATRLNLVAEGDLEALDWRHAEDSLRAQALVEDAPPGPVVDVGAGAGFPGIPLAIALPDRAWRLLERRQRRAAFLELVVRELDLGHCEVLALSAEEAAADPGLAGVHACALARALAAPPAAFDLLRPLVAPGGRSIVFIGESAEIPRDAVEVLPGLAMIEVSE